MRREDLAWGRWLVVIAVVGWCALFGGVVGRVAARATGDVSFGLRKDQVASPGAAGEIASGTGVAVALGGKGEVEEIVVGDPALDRVSVFDGAGGFLRAFGGGVATGAHELQVCTTSCETGLAGSGVGEFSAESGMFVAVNNDAASALFHDVYVFDNRNYRIEVFKPSGVFALMFGRQVDKTKTEEIKEPGNPHGVTESEENVCTAASGDVCGTGVKGESAGQFSGECGTPTGFTPYCGIVVSATGVVWAADHERVQQFEADGSFVAQEKYAGVTFEMFGVDEPGEAFYAGTRNGGIALYASGGLSCAISDRFGALHTAIGVASNGNVFVDDVEKAGSRYSGLAEFGPECRQLEQWDVHPETNGVLDAEGIAVVGDGGPLVLVDQGLLGEGPGRIVALPAPGPLVQEESERAFEVGVVSGRVEATVNAEGAQSECEFVYVPEAAYKQSGFSSPEAKKAGCVPDPIKAGFEETIATGTITGLAPETGYDYHVIAKNANGTTEAPAQTFTTSPAVSFSLLPVTEPGQSDVSLAGYANPHGLPTSVQVEYWAAGTGVQSTPAQQVGEGLKYTLFSASIGSLAPGTLYHYRLAGKNSAGSAHSTESTFTTSGGACSNSTLRTGASGLLPECRAYEQVTPAEKNGVSIAAEIRARPDGQAISYVALQPLAGSPTGLLSNYIATRAPTGWENTNISPPINNRPLEGSNDWPYIVDMTPDLTRAVIQAAYPISPQAQGIATLAQPTEEYLREPDGQYTLLSHGPILPDTLPGEIRFEGADTQLNHIFFATTSPLTRQTTTSTSENLYQWNEGHIELVNQAPTTNTPLPGGAQLAAKGEEDAPPQLTPDLGTPQEETAVSSDGSTVFFQSPLAGNGTPELYVRSHGETTEISLSHRASDKGRPAGRAQFLVATTNGSTVFFYSSSQLTENAPEGGGIYKYQTGRQELTLATADPVEQIHVIVATSDCSQIYLTQIRHGQSTEVEELHEEHLTTIAAETGYSSVEVRTGSAYRTGGALAPSPDGAMSPNGQFFAFDSKSNLTPYDSHEHPEIYEYNNETQTTACISCRPNGQPPTGESALDNATFAVGGIPKAPAVILNDGTVFFNSTDTLLERDKNKQENAYEYNEGQLNLVSTGESPSPSEIASVSEDGQNVFLFTYQSLVPQDTDNGVADLYDARINGGIAAPPTPPQCQNQEACHPTTNTPPLLETPTSNIFTGPGNPTPTTPPTTKPTAPKLTKPKPAHPKHSRCRKPPRNCHTPNHKQHPHKHPRHRHKTPPHR